MEEESAFKGHYNSRIIDAYMKMIDLRYSYVDKNDLLSYAGMESYQIADQGHWFTQEQVDRFYERLQQLTGKNTLAREAGRFFASFQEGNLMKKYFLSLLGPVGAYEKMVKVSRNFTNYTDYTVKKLSQNSVEVVLSIQEGMDEKPYQCENRMGILEAITMLFGLKTPRIEHPECFFKQGNCCRYIVTWENSRALALKKIRNLLATGGVLLNIGLAILYPVTTFSYVLPASIIATMVFVVVVKHKEVVELEAKINASQSTTDELFHQIDINYNTTLISHEVGQVVNHKMTLDEILEGAIKIIEHRLEFDRGLILLANEKKTHLIFRQGFGYNEIHRLVLQSNVFHLDNPKSRGVFVTCFKEQRPFLVNNIEDIKKDLSLRSLEFTRSMGSHAFICCPIVCDNEPLGILSVDNLHTQRPLIQSDISLLMGLASSVGIGIKKVQLLDNREIQLRSIIEVLASSIDARDPLTAGHSEKVTEYAQAICRRMNLPREYCEVIRIASLLHDYGKIGVPDNILKKNGKLSTEEYSIIKTHVVKTREILNRINFEGPFSEIPHIAGSHHERLDGLGYPLGLKGKEIPIGARIIAAADFFEAITSKRHYRSPMSFQEALMTLFSETGDHLDPKVVKVFSEYLLEKHGQETGLIRENVPDTLQQTPLQRIKGV